MIEIFAFTVAAIALLGSPGPAIAAILAVGKRDGWTGGVRFFAGLQVGLASAAAITAAGLFAIISTSEMLLLSMSILATAYLVYLSYKIASAPVGDKSETSGQGSSVAAGVFLGLTNPKAYLAFASLLASFTLVKNDLFLDGFSKWAVIVMVMIVVDWIWLWIGVRLGKLDLSAGQERVMNVVLGLTVLLAAVLAWT